MNQETPKPNFDFIVNQPGPELNKPKRSKKPLIIMGVAVFILLGLVAFAAIFGKKATNVQQAAFGTTEATQLFSYIAENNVDSAFDMLKPVVQLDKTFFADNLVQPYSQRFDLTNCILEQNGYQLTDTEAKLTYDCPYKDKQNGGKVILAITVDRPTSKIAKIEMVTNR